MGDVPQQLALAADQALQPCAHAVEIVGQHTEFIAAVGKLRQAVLLIRGLPQIVHGAAQSAQWAGDRQRDQKTEQREDNECYAERAERP